MKKYYFLLIAVTIIFCRPWFWQITRSTFEFGIYPHVLTIVVGFVIGSVYLKFNGKKWQLLLCVFLLPGLAMELMWYFSYLIHYAANDVHMYATPSWPKEMYRDFNSYFDFAYGQDNWKFRLKNIIVDTVLIITVVFTFINVKQRFKQTQL